MSVDPSRLGRTVPPSFAGLSIEPPDVPTFTGTPASPNRAFIHLLRALDSPENGPPSLRIGGLSSDQSWWNPSGVGRPPGIDTDIDQAWVSGLTSVMARARAPLVLGLNLALADSTNAAALAQAVLERAPPGLVRSFELGNEPDLYAKPRTFRVGSRRFERFQHRTAYDFGAYERELDPYLATLAGTGVPLSIGGFATSAWTARSGELLDHAGDRAQVLSTHSYPLQTCGSQRRRPKSILVRQLLNSRGSLRRVARLAAVAHSRGDTLQISETNSAICGGVSGVSDAFASALWGTDILFGYFKAGADAANLHTFNGAWYAPVEFARRRGRLVAIVHPLFYGMLLFSRATANRARLVRSHWRDHRNLRVWSTQAHDGAIRIVLLNLSTRVDRRLRVHVSGKPGSAEVERLTAPGLRARYGVRLAGQTYGRHSAAGRMSGRRLRAPVKRVGGGYELSLPHASAVLVEVSPRR